MEANEAEMEERRGLVPKDKSEDIQQLLDQNKRLRKYNVSIIIILVLMVVLIVALFVVNVYNTIESANNSNRSDTSADAANIANIMKSDEISAILLNGCNISSKPAEFVLLLDDSCGLTDEQCAVQLTAAANLVYAIKAADVNPQISIISMKDANDNFQKSNIFVELNDPNYQFNVEEFYQEIISSGPCGNGGASTMGSNPNLLYSINLAAAQLQYQGNPHIADQKIIILSNCEALLSSIKDESNEKICSAVGNIIGLNNVDIHFINAPISNDLSSSFSVQSPNQYISCLINNDASKITVIESFDQETFNEKIAHDLSTICEYTAPPKTEITTETATENTQCGVEMLRTNVSMNLTSRALPQKVLPGSQFFAYSYNMLTGKPPLDLLRDGTYKQILQFSFDKQQVSAGSSDYLVPDQMDIPSIAGVCHKQSSTSSVSRSSSLSALSRQSSDHSDSMSASVSASGGGYGVSISASFGMSLGHSNSQSSSNSRESAKAGKTESSYTFSKAFLYAAQMRWDIIHELSSYKSEFIDALSEITKIKNATSLNTPEKLVPSAEATYVGNGCCRDELGGYQIWKTYDVNITDCWNKCMELDYCTGIDYRSGGLRVCNLHNEVISYYDPYCEAMNCYKKTTYGITNMGFLNFGIGACSAYNDSYTLFDGGYDGLVSSLTECIQECKNRTATKCTGVTMGYLKENGLIDCYFHTKQILMANREMVYRCYIDNSVNLLKKDYGYNFGVKLPSWRNNFWQTAENYCNNNYGSHLATINDDDEYHAFGKLCSEFPGITLCLFGLHQFAGRNWKFSSNANSESVAVSNFTTRYKGAVDSYAAFIGHGIGEYSIIPVTDATIEQFGFVFACDNSIDYEGISNSAASNYNEIDSQISQTVIAFFQNFGTAVVEVGKMGAHCSKTRHFQSGMTSEAYSNSNEQASASSQSYEASISGGYSGFGVSVSVSASFGYSSSDSQSSGSEGSGNQEGTVESEEMKADCSGEVFITSECGGMFGTQNQPALVSYSLKPIWKIRAFDEFPDTEKAIESVLHSLNEAGLECGLKHCGGLSICGANYNFWTTPPSQQYLLWNGYDYSVFWNGDMCFNQYHIGTSILSPGDDITSFKCSKKNYEGKELTTRKERHQIKFDPFCEDDDFIFIASGLTVVNRSVSFQTHVSNIKPNGFDLTYELTSNGRNRKSEYNDWIRTECTDVGAVSFAVFCGMTNVRTKTVQITNQEFNIEFPDLEILPALECVNRGVVAVYSGFRYNDKVLDTAVPLDEMKIYSAFSVDESHVYLSLTNGVSEYTAAVVDESGDVNETTFANLYSEQNSLNANECLFWTESNNAQLISKNGGYSASFQSDGNFIIYQLVRGFSYVSYVFSNIKPGKIVCLNDGYLRIFGGNGVIVWDTASRGQSVPGSYLILQDDGVLVMYASDNQTLVWSSSNWYGGAAATVLWEDFYSPSNSWKQNEYIRSSENSYIISNNGDYTGIFQEDGNFVIYSNKDRGVTMFSTATNTGSFSILCLDNDGFLKVYEMRPVQYFNIFTFDINYVQTLIWNSRDHDQKQPGAYVIIQDDGTLAIYASDQLTRVWSSKESSIFVKNKNATAQVSTTVQSKPILKEFSVSIIHFCESDKIRYGEVAIHTYKDLIPAPHFGVWSEYVTYDQGSFNNCDDVDIFLGFSGFQIGACNVATWTKDHSMDGFTLVLSVWSTEYDFLDNIGVTHKAPDSFLDCARNRGEKGLENSYWKSYVMIQYFATCHKL
eukprot:52405_1